MSLEACAGAVDTSVACSLFSSSATQKVRGNGFLLGPHCWAQNIFAVSDRAVDAGSNSLCTILDMKVNILVSGLQILVTQVALPSNRLEDRCRILVEDGRSANRSFLTHHFSSQHQGSAQFASQYFKYVHEFWDLNYYYYYPLLMT
eukprot:487012-Pelagomonas_calceolata.AAC.1